MRMADRRPTSWRVPGDCMGEINAEMRLENSGDRSRFENGDIAESEIRRCTVSGVVDTGARTLALPKDIVDELGLKSRWSQPVRYADGRREELAVAGPVTLDIMGREMMADCFVLPTDSEPLIGQIILERLDFVADCANETLMPNPASPDAPLIPL